MKTRGYRRAGFTLVELMVVMTVLGLLAAVVIPRFVRARTASETSVCIDNLREINGAIHQYSLVENVVPTTALGYSDISGYIEHNIACPAGGSNATFATSYKIADCQTKPSCVVVPATHLLAN